MGLSVSPVLGSDGAQPPKPVEIELKTLANPDSSELLGIMRENFVRQSVWKEPKGTAYLTENDNDLILDLELHGPNEKPPKGAMRLDNVQTLPEGGGVALGRHTNYLITPPFSGCSFFLLRIGQTDQAFHIKAAAPNRKLPEKLERFLPVSRALLAASGDEDLASVVTAYLANHSERGMAKFKDRNSRECVEYGLALMVWENISAVSGHAFTSDAYSRGKGYDMKEGGMAYWGSAMLARDAGRWIMLEQSALLQHSDDVENKLLVRDISAQRTILDPPDLLTKLKELAGLVKKPPLDAFV
ncbi:MAG: hypothetical protein H0S85_04910 [Desulfovibrionaceae bacterium]|jgi:hypothetical protein|nr:hypothetical protein [Desulfovibrionaceae bacterium]